MTETSEPAALLKRVWGFDAFHPLQREAVDAALAGRDCLVVLPTGGGKSLCYQLPAAAGRLVLVVSPLISLMDDQVAAARQVGVAAGAIHSNLAPAQRHALEQEAVGGSLRLIYVSPERLVQGELLHAIGERVDLVAIDEAHCVSHWGHDFRPEYRQLAAALGHAPRAARMALTATATPDVQRDIRDELALRDPLELIGHPDRPNLIYRSFPRAGAAEQVLSVIRRRAGEGGIVYAQTRKEVERLAARLQESGVNCAGYHAGMGARTREHVQSGFVAERLDVVVATIAFGMGIDRSNVRYVVHANTPKSIEHYQQESGRAGRDGLPAECVLLYAASDLQMYRMLAERDGELSEERRQALQRQLAAIARYAVAPVCRHRLLSEHFGAAWPPPHTDAAAGVDACGACDVCLGETVAMPDEKGLVLAQKILSAVHRTGENFGATHVDGVLRGAATERLRALGHDDLSVFGLLHDESRASVRAWIDQLIAQDALQIVERVSGERRFPILKLTQLGNAILRGKRQPRLTRFFGAKGARARPGRRKGVGADAVALGSEEEALFQKLRALRRILAERASVPPYVVFSDATLRELALTRPATDAGFLAVKGVGETKLRRYGAAFRAAVSGTSAEDAANVLEA